MSLFEKTFKGVKPVIGMVHLLPLPSAPGYDGDLEKVYRQAVEDLMALKEGGANAFIVENFGDIPYSTENELITYTAFTSIAARLRELTDMSMGINVQFDNYEAEWAIAYAVNADFIRVEAFGEHRMGPNGYCPASGPKLARLKQRYPKDICILADVNVKHTFPLVEMPLDFTIESIIEGGADALICTGIMTGKSPSLDDVKQMKLLAGDVPVVVGSGVNAKTAKDYFEVGDGAIIGSSLKVDGKVNNPVDVERVKALVKALER